MEYLMRSLSLLPDNADMSNRCLHLQVGLFPILPVWTQLIVLTASDSPEHRDQFPFLCTAGILRCIRGDQ